MWSRQGGSTYVSASSRPPSILHPRPRMPANSTTPSLDLADTDWEVPSVTNSISTPLASDDELDDFSAPSVLDDGEPWESMYEDNDRHLFKSSSSSMHALTADLIAESQMPVSAHATSASADDNQPKSGAMDASISQPSSMTNSSSTFSYSFPDPLSTSLLEEKDIQVRSKAEGSESTSSDIDTHSVIESAADLDKPVEQELLPPKPQRRAFQAPTLYTAYVASVANVVALFHANPILSGIAIAAVVLGCALHSAFPPPARAPLPATTTPSPTPTSKWYNPLGRLNASAIASQSSVATLPSVLEKVTGQSTSTLSMSTATPPLESSRENTQQPAITREESKSYKPFKWFATLPPAERPEPLLLESPSSKSNRGPSLGGFVGIRPPTPSQPSASKAKPVPETPPTDSRPEWKITHEKSLSPFSAFTTSLSISYDSLRRILFNDLQDLLSALDELYSFVSQHIQQSRDAVAYLAVQSRTCVGYLNEKLQEYTRTDLATLGTYDVLEIVENHFERGHAQARKNARRLRGAVVKSGTEMVKVVGQELKMRNQVALQNARALGVAVQQRINAARYAIAKEV